MRVIPRVVSPRIREPGTFPVGKGCAVGCASETNAANVTYDAYRTPGEIRTPTDQFLKLAPLPLGYRGGVTTENRTLISRSTFWRPDRWTIATFDTSPPLQAGCAEPTGLEPAIFTVTG